MRRSSIALVLLATAFSMLTAAGAVAIFQQQLPPPPTLRVSASALCGTNQNPAPLVNVTNPNPIFTGGMLPTNGTIVYGCGFLTDRSTVSGAVQITKAGNYKATFSLPSGTNIYLVQNDLISLPLGLGALSQAQCAASPNILLSSGSQITIPVGSYSYCESFNDATTLTTVVVSWSQ